MSKARHQNHTHGSAVSRWREALFLQSVAQCSHLWPALLSSGAMVLARLAATLTVLAAVALAAEESPGLRGAALSGQVEASVESQGPCDHGFAKTAKMLAPKCMKACPSLCGPMGGAAKAFLGKGKQKGAMQEMCAHKHEFACAFEHRDVCDALGRKARNMGFSMPTSKEDLYGKCR